MYSEDDYIMISALQHYLFCPRQCALIHLDQYWSENLLTASGRVMHERVDTPGTRHNPDCRIEYSGSALLSPPRNQRDCRSGGVP